MIYLILIILANFFDAFSTKYSANYVKKGHMSGHIVGGVPVSIDSYPQTAMLSIGVAPFCGGVIISDRVILTAAHCLYAGDDLIPLHYVDINLGSSFAARGVKYTPCKAIIHENYKHNIGYMWDIAVILLQKKIKFGRSIQKAKLVPHTKWRQSIYSFAIAGFGTTSTFGTTSQKLRGIKMNYISNELCNRAQVGFDDEGNMFVPDHMFCLISSRGSSDCYGDSGSGVIWNGYVVGLVATGRDSSCGSGSIPSMYTDVYFFRDWIKSKMHELEMLSLKKCEPENNSVISDFIRNWAYDK